MSTDLVPTGSTPITTVDDVTENVQLVASHPEEMQLAQQSLAEWFRKKMEIIEQDVADAEANLDIATRNGWKATTFERQKRITRKRRDFYAKCLAAVEAGYAIVPNFPVDVFAIRTKKRNPGRDEWHSELYFEQRAEGLPQGDGRYVSDHPKIGTVTRHEENPKTKLLEPKKKYFPKAFDDEIEFPIAISKPEILSAAQRAIAMKIFDEVGCLPNRRQKGDPILTGSVLMRNGYSTKRVTFLIAWWIDTKDL